MDDRAKEITLCVLGVAISLVPWLLDKLGHAMPRWAYALATALGLLAIAWSLNRLRWIEAIPGLSRRVTLASVLVTFGTLAALLWLYRSNLWQAQPSPVPLVATKTTARLQFNAAGTYPAIVDLANVFRVYWFTHVTQFRSFNAKGEELDDQHAFQGRSWLVLIVFDKPVPLREVRINAHGAKLPHYEVKDSNERYALIYFAGDLVSTALTITVEN